ncbi:response regulator transcription factor [Alloscardovia venturai]|uniref:Response regulator transcription factor n=1 Tax=Alloscardovia venturai TaxID=1769421 RepID=A0ABW2Y6C1_9BIFI
MSNALHQHHILVIDDDVAITSMLMTMLSKAGYAVTVLNDSRRISSTDISSFSLILCDVMMPHKDGFELVRSIRDSTAAPIIFLTAKVTEDDALTGYASGADDYIRKPFSMAELLAKVEAHIRRSERAQRNTHNVLSFGSIHIDIITQEVSISGATEQKISLTTTQWAILEYLATHPSATFSREQLAELLEFSDDSSIAMHVSNLRAKFKKFNLSPITTVWGVGYRWTA